MSTQTPNRVAISGPGLKKQGVVVLQTLFIALFTLLELRIRDGVGIVTGLVICVAVFGPRVHQYIARHHLSVFSPVYSGIGVANLYTSRAPELDTVERPAHSFWWSSVCFS